MTQAGCLGAWELRPYHKSGIGLSDELPRNQ